MTSHGDTKTEVALPLKLAALFLVLSGWHLIRPEIGLAGSILQATPPCEVVDCSKPGTSHENACNKAFIAFSRNGLGGDPDWNQGRNYLDRCFHKSNELPHKIRQQLHATVIAILKLSGASHCTGSLISNQLVLTARHCLVDMDNFEQSPKAPMDPALLSTLSIIGIGDDGGKWTRKIASISFDPFADGSQVSLSKAYDSRKESYPRTLDFVVVQLDSPLSTGTPPIPLASDEKLTSLTAKHRLLLGFFRQEKEEGPPTLYVDDFPSCLIREIDPTRGYLHHHCQAYESISGAAIFSQSPEGELSIIAVHVASAGNTIPKEKTLVTGNEGALIAPVLSGLR